MGGDASTTRGGDGSGDLACLRRFLFSTRGAAAARAARRLARVLLGAGRGTRVRRDRAAHPARRPRAASASTRWRSSCARRSSYFGLLEHALRRAGVPAWFDRGTRRPHPAGRAFLALLACAAEQLSAARFAEYLSLGQVPQPDGDPDDVSGPLAGRGARPRGGRAADDEAETEARQAATEPRRRRRGGRRRHAARAVALGEAARRGRGHRPATPRAGSGGSTARRGSSNGRRDEARARGRRRQPRRRRRSSMTLRAAGAPARVRAADHRRRWPRGRAQATWGEWLDRFEALAPARAARARARAARARRSAADGRRRADRSRRSAPRARRAAADARVGAAGAPLRPRLRRHAAAGARPQLPRRVRARAWPSGCFRRSRGRIRCCSTTCAQAVDAALPTQRERLDAERLLLQLAAGAARERLYVSYPRIELSESRARVPSFYALDVMRAATGRVPRSRAARGAGARVAGDATLAWPAPPRPEDAIDDQEHDLAVLRRLLDETDPSRGQGARALPAEAERVPAPLGRRPVGARPAPVVAERRADARVAAHDGRRWRRSG